MDKYKETIKNNKVIFIILFLSIILLISLVYYYEIKVPNTFVYQDFEEPKYEVYKYNDNEYKVMNITDENMMGIYYNYIKNLMFTNQDKMWNMLSDDAKIKFKDLKNFKRIINGKITKKSFSNTLKKYSIKKGSVKELYLEDNEDNKFVIKEKAVWDIEIVNIY